jgi:hypothetical protein
MGMAGRAGEPVTCGVPWRRGEIDDAKVARLSVFGSDGHPRNTDVVIAARWPDQTARWLRVNWLLEDKDTSSFTLRLVEADTVTPRAEPMPLTLPVQLGDWLVHEHDGPGLPFAISQSTDKANSYAIELVVVRTDAQAPTSVKFTAPRVSSAGALCANVMLEGVACFDDGASIDVRVEVQLHPDSKLLTFRAEFTNPAPAGHPGGIWTLGDSGSIYIEHVTLELSRQHAQLARMQTSLGGDWQAGDTLALYQDSSGGEQWNSPNHFNRDGQSTTSSRGYSLLVDGQEGSRGDRASPLVKWGEGSTAVVVAPHCFWQTFPKSLGVRAGKLEIGILPRECAQPHELQGGERFAFEACIGLGEQADAGALSWTRDRAIAHVSAEWMTDSGAIDHFSVPSLDADHAQFIEAVLEGEESFEAKCERIDEYGWRNFGDINADHEAAYHEGSEPFVSHYNNQYDPLASFALAFLRTGDPRWYRQMDALAAHLATIDIYHTDQDKSAYNGGMFWHTTHYVEAGLSTHRTYPNAPGVSGGGPSTEHLYTSGFALHHLMTGRGFSREAVVELGKFVLRADDGNLTPFRLFDRSATGLVSCSGSMDYHGPGRGPGNAIDALLNAFSLSGERRFLSKSEELVRRCIHPLDDIPARDLGDIERRWFYMVFLKSLLKYLDVKLTLGEVDEQYHYARVSLLNYLDWAVEHEYAYLDRPELLDFPNETWAAQEMRKADVFELAACHASSDQAMRYRERARFFFRASIDGLNAFPETRLRARPLVLLLGFGFAHVGLRDSPVQFTPEAARHPQETIEWPAPIHFVRQKRRAVQKAVIGAGVGGMACLAALAWLVLA